MSALSRILRAGESNTLSFWCPACDSAHSIRHGVDGWTWNGNAEKPTFTPSILVRNGHYAPHYEAGDACWCSFNAEQVANGKEPTTYGCAICHSFVKDGLIEFCGDSTHALAGQTAPLAEWPGDVE